MRLLLLFKSILRSAYFTRKMTLLLCHGWAYDGRVQRVYLLQAPLHLEIQVDFVLNRVLQRLSFNHLTDILIDVKRRRNFYFSDHLKTS